MLLPTRPQQYCDPASLVVLYFSRCIFLCIFLIFCLSLCSIPCSYCRSRRRNQSIGHGTSRKQFGAGTQIPFSPSLRRYKFERRGIQNTSEAKRRRREITAFLQRHGQRERQFHRRHRASAPASRCFFLLGDRQQRHDRRCE